MAAKITAQLKVVCAHRNLEENRQVCVSLSHITLVVKAHVSHSRLEQTQSREQQFGCIEFSAFRSTKIQQVSEKHIVAYSLYDLKIVYSCK